MKREEHSGHLQQNKSVEIVLDPPIKTLFTSIHAYIWPLNRSVPAAPTWKNSTVSGNKFLCLHPYRRHGVHARARARAHADSRGCPASPGVSTQIGCQMLQTAALITAFYEYITFYVHPNTDLFPFAQNQRGHTFPRTLRRKKNQQIN